MTNLKIFQRLIISLIDATASFFIFQVGALLLAPIYFLPFFPGYWAVWSIYFIVSYCCFRKSLGQSFLGVGIEIDQSIIPSGVRIFLRESLTSFPAIIFWTTRWAPIVPWLSISAFIICMTALIFRNKLFGIKLKRYDSSPASYNSCWIYLTLILAGVLARVVNISYTADKEVLSKSPFNTEPRPSVYSAQKYIDFIKDNRQNINDYIMRLFNEYDHVILCERIHPEMTQYDMIYNLVTDKRFVDSIGVVFTEIGNIESRDAYSRLVDTSFENDTLLEKNLASFMMDNQTVWLLWTNTNWFDFLKRMYYFNHKRKDRIRIMFSDRNWIDQSELAFRDSIIGDNIISTINSGSVTKSLIIMNYRHAFLTQGNVGYYLNRSFPGKVANVMINSANPIKLMMPVQNGYWDVATEQIHPVEYAFDFNDSPFGEDSFDFALMSKKMGLKYQDMFTGIIFYKSQSEQYVSDGFNYIFEPENIKKIEERAGLLPEEAKNPYLFLKGGIYIRDSLEMFGVIVRIANLTIIGVILFSLLLNGIMWFFIYKRRSNRG
ncbi:hypothetical protein [uncultured Duncaniella sp.]|uniref:hypothetical protein n=1 Tax=uncultured Duncaniella sp. TaxID=2768039 RepID=UPI0026051641|nr:hypothetical protein [uncultured Duncaniella sp.]